MNFKKIVLILFIIATAVFVTRVAYCRLFPPSDASVLELVYKYEIGRHGHDDYRSFIDAGTLIKENDLNVITGMRGLTVYFLDVSNVEGDRVELVRSTYLKLSVCRKIIATETMVYKSYYFNDDGKLYNNYGMEID